MLNFVAHYLHVEWLERGVARQIQISADPIEVHSADDGIYRADTEIFRDFHPWVGLRFTSTAAEITPATFDSRGRSRPWLRIVDNQQRNWWVQDDGWDESRHAHFSALHRSVGQFEVALGSVRLYLTNIALELGRAEAEDYLADFRDDLIILALYHDSSATGQVFRSEARDLVSALSEFAVAARRILDDPAQELKEVERLQPMSRLRPSAATFREILQHPGRRSYHGRDANQVLDIPDNQFMHHMVRHCAKLASAIAQASKAQAGQLLAQATRATNFADDLANADSEKVSPDVFDNQLAEMQAAIDAVNNWTPSGERGQTRVRQFKIKVEKSYSRLPNTHFYKRTDADPQVDKDLGITSSIVRMPDEVHRRVERASKYLSYSDEITFTASYKLQLNPFKDSMRLLHLEEVHEMVAHTKIVERKVNLRARYERDGWNRKLTPIELKERQLEARSHRRRAADLARRSENAVEAASILSGAKDDLFHQSNAWVARGVKIRTETPTGMRFVQNPRYGAALAEFKRVLQLSKYFGAGGELLDRIERVGILHASALFERWCLVKIISLLVNTFQFVPQTGWLGLVVEGTSGSRGSFGLIFRRDDVGLSARLEVQSVLENGRRPDFRLSFHRGSKTSFLDATKGVILDAKFRTRWRDGEIENVLHDLVELRNYGNASRRVFILQPAGGVVPEPISPLSWGRHCDYGQNAPKDHHSGSIQVSPGQLENLSRLIALELQASFPEPTNSNADGWTSNSFCIACGHSHQDGDVRHRLTSGGNDAWALVCNACGLVTDRTHCRGGCGTALFKNGLHLTYHHTIADQLSNVVCPCCGQFFDRDVHGADDKWNQRP